MVSFFPPDNISKEQIKFATNVIVISFVATLAGFIFSPIYYYLGHTTGALIIFIPSITVTINPFLLKTTGNLTLTRHIPALFMFIVQVGLAYTQDGLETTSLAWFTTIPIISLFTAGIGVSIFWALLSALTIIVFYLFPVMGFSLPVNPLSTEKMSLLLTLGTAGLILYLLGFGIANELLKDAAIRKMDKMANEDMLTGIFNRRKFFELGIELFEREEKLFAIMLDIDKFKAINDTYGHPVGDEVIKKLAKTIMALTNNDDLFGRLGGEEFAIICVEEDETKVKAHIEKIRHAIESQKVIADGQNTVKFTISSGIAKKTYDLKNLDYLLKAADDALYEAKAKGRNRVIFRV